MSKHVFWVAVLAACGSGALEFSPDGRYEGAARLDAGGATSTTEAVLRIDTVGITTAELFPGCFWRFEEVSRDESEERALYVFSGPSSCDLGGVEYEFLSGSMNVNRASAELEMQGFANGLQAVLRFEGIYAGESR